LSFLFMRPPYPLMVRPRQHTAGDGLEIVTRFTAAGRPAG
jgi:hypothetical protein